jgi:hypothetical protein
MMGPTQFRRGNKYGEDLHGNAKPVRIGATRSKMQNKVNANDEVYALAA